MVATNYCDALVQQYWGRSIALDSNLLLLLLVGSFDINLLTSFKRLSEFSRRDLSLLQSLSTIFPIVTSPHVLTELSNLANALPERVKLRVFPYIASRVPFLEEVFLPATEIVKSPGFSVFGLTDIALSELCMESLLITHDERFAAYLRHSRKLPVLTLNDLRAAELDLLTDRRSGRKHDR